MKKKATKQERPNINTAWWWDWDYEKMNFRKAHIAVITRIIERGNKDDYVEMIRFYGIDQILHDLKHEIWFLTDRAIEKACNYFSLQKEEIKCYTFKQSRQIYWL